MLDKVVSKKLCDKWAPILEGIEDPYIKESTARLLENQARYLVSEEAIGTGGTTTGKIGTFQKFAFPMVRRIMPELLAHKLCGVQPMDGPVSQIFYLGHSRVADGGRVETVYSKYALTYNNRVASALPSISGIHGGWVDASGTSLAISGLNAAGTGPKSDARPAILSGSIGGFIAKFPNAATLTQFNISAGERLTTTGIPEINLHIEQQPVVARTRKFRALWTVEASQDLKAYHNINLENELTDLMSQEVELEIDREIIEDIRSLAYDIVNPLAGFNRAALDLGNSNNFGLEHDWTPESFTFDNTGNAALPGNNRGQLNNVFFVDFRSSNMPASPRHVGDLYSNLVAVINFAAYDIHKSTYRGPGNWILTSPHVAAMLENAAKLQGGLEKSDFNCGVGEGIQWKGKIFGRYDMYVDPLYPEGEILIGRKGASPMEGGYVYAPYIPVMPLDRVVDPESFQPRKGLLTRYGKAIVAPASRWYRVVRIIGDTSGNFLFTPFDRPDETRPA